MGVDSPQRSHLILSEHDMQITVEQAKEQIRGVGLRSTLPRIAVLRLLSGEGRPLSHSEVVQHLGEVQWDQATLYRNLIRLTETGLIRVASEAAGVKRYEVSKRPHSVRQLHPHFVCNDCGVVSCLPEVLVSQKTEVLTQN